MNSKRLCFICFRQGEANVPGRGREPELYRRTDHGQSIRIGDWSEGKIVCTDRFTSTCRREDAKEFLEQCVNIQQKVD